MSNKALQLTRRRPGACEVRGPAGGRVRWQERRPPAGVSSGYTGGAQLSAVSVRPRPAWWSRPIGSRISSGSRTLSDSPSSPPSRSALRSTCLLSSLPLSSVASRSERALRLRSAERRRGARRLGTRHSKRPCSVGVLESRGLRGRRFWRVPQPACSAPSAASPPSRPACSPRPRAAGVQRGGGRPGFERPGAGRWAEFACQLAGLGSGVRPAEGGRGLTRRWS